MKRKSNKNNYPDNEWKRKIYEKSNYCQYCGRDYDWFGSLDVHHVLGKNAFPEYRHHRLNGIVLCRECHSKVHSIPSFKNLVWDKLNLWEVEKEIKGII